MRKLYIPLLLLISLICHSAYSSPKTKIGVSLPLKGAAATYGTDILNSIKFANEELFNNRYDLVIEDDNCSGIESVSVAKKLTEIDKVKYVLGFACSTTVLTTAPIYERSKVVIISQSATAPAISDAGDYIFRTFPSSRSGAYALADLIAKKHKNFAMISEETDYSQGVSKDMKEALAGKPISLISEDYVPGTSDFRSILTRLRAKDVDSILINPQAEDRLILIFRQIKEMNWDVQIYGFIYPSSPTFLSAVGADANGVIFADTPGFSDLPGDKAGELFAKFVSKYGPPISSDFCFSTSLIAFQALDEAIRSGKPVKDYLLSHTFETIHGKFSFDKNGDPVGLDYVLKKIVDGKTVPLAD